MLIRSVIEMMEMTATHIHVQMPIEERVTLVVLCLVDRTCHYSSSAGYCEHTLAV